MLQAPACAALSGTGAAYSNAATITATTAAAPSNAATPAPGLSTAATALYEEAAMQAENADFKKLK